MCAHVTGDALRDVLCEMCVKCVACDISLFVMHMCVVAMPLVLQVCVTSVCLCMLLMSMPWFVWCVMVCGCRSTSDV